MKNIALKLWMISSVLALAACSSNNENFPSLGTGSQSASGGSSVNTGTFVGQKVIAFRQELSQIQASSRANNEELQRIRDNILKNTTEYNKNTGAIETRLQVGTTPGNPTLYTILGQAQNNIQTMGANNNALEGLSARVANNATSNGYLLDSVRAAFSISGAVDEDHAQLRTLQNEVEQTGVLINNLNTEVTSDLARQQQHLAQANAQINHLGSAIRVGNFQGAPRASNVARPERPLFSGKSTPVAAPLRPVPVRNVERASMGRPTPLPGKPLFAVKFSRDDIDYKSDLTTAVNAAVNRKPNAVFEVVGVSNVANRNKAQAHADKIFREIVALGVNANNVNIGAKISDTLQVAEVLVFVK